MHECMRDERELPQGFAALLDSIKLPLLTLCHTLLPKQVLVDMFCVVSA